MHVFGLRDEIPEAQREHVNSVHTGMRWESNPKPWRCKANVLTTKPPLIMTYKNL